MAIVVARPTPNPDFTDGNRRRRVRTITLNSSYTTTGDTLTPAQVGLRVITEAIPHGAFRSTDGTSAVDVHYSRSQQKLLAYWGNAGTASVLPEVTSGTDLSGYVGTMTFLGW